MHGQFLFKVSYVRFGNIVFFNLLADDNGDPISLEKVRHIAFWPDIYAAFFIASIKALNLLFVPLNVSTDVKAACIIVSSNLSKAS